MLPHVFDELRQYWNTDKFKAMSEQAKRLEAILRVAHYTPEVQRPLEQLQEKWKKNWGRTPIGPEVFKKTYVKKKENDLDLDVKSGRGTHKGRVYGLGSRNDVRRLQSGLEGIGSSHQVEALDGVQIVAMSAQIPQLTLALAESE
ncbi:hypothetical protein MTR67_030668 [Solanum verrucosum]|uniref:Uncharacterized protein n=1 Tax=Solanum verrucosum TaxID=315347 RepID=A0AAF0U138_SOLVR|nr:hypothetical protein MTR67_030668 [Solanum verrucosum]